MFSIFVGFTGLKSESWPDIQLAGSQLLANPTPCQYTLFNGPNLVSPFSRCHNSHWRKELVQVVFAFHSREKLWEWQRYIGVCERIERPCTSQEKQAFKLSKGYVVKPPVLLTWSAYLVCLLGLLAYMVCKIKFDEVSFDVQKSKTGQNNQKTKRVIDPCTQGVACVHARKVVDGHTCCCWTILAK